jgi:hypothetical protein
MDYDGNFLLKVPVMDRIVSRDSHHSPLVGQKLDLNHGTGRFTLVTDVRINSGLTQAVTSSRKFSLIINVLRICVLLNSRKEEKINDESLLWAQSWCRDSLLSANFYSFALEEYAMSEERKR